VVRYTRVISEQFGVSLLCWSVANLHFRELENSGAKRPCELTGDRGFSARASAAQ